MALLRGYETRAALIESRAVREMIDGCVIKVSETVGFSSNSMMYCRLVGESIFIKRILI